MELKPIAEFTSCCSTTKVSPLKQPEKRPAKIKPIEAAVFVAALAGWWLVYQNLLPMARFLTY